MEQTAVRQVPGTDADGILRELTIRQHLTPHRPVGLVLSDIVERIGACPVAADRAVSRLELDDSKSIGRLKRGELIQLARSIYRQWCQTLTLTASNTHPT
jgi:hypothetical protein